MTTINSTAEKGPSSLVDAETWEKRCAAALTKDESALKTLGETLDERRKSTTKKFKADVESLEKRFDDDSAALNNLVGEISPLRDEIESSADELRGKSGDKAKLAADVEEASSLRDAQNNLLGRKRFQIDERLKRVTDSFLPFQKHLGFTVLSNDGNLEFRFSRVDRQTPRRIFGAVIHLDSKTNAYSLVSAAPSVAGVEELVKALNRDHNLKRFLFKLRKTFVESLI